MMIVGSVAKAAAAAAVATLGFRSGRNILQTFRILARRDDRSPPRRDPNTATLPRPETVDDLSRLSRGQLVELFLSSSPPTNLSELSGDWNGTLLPNNGLVRACVCVF
jgi:hypothetical protein